MSIAAKRAIQPKCSAASSGVLETTGTFRPAADHLGDGPERHALLGDRVIGAARGALFERQPVEPGGIETMHAGPAVLAVADIGRDAFLARDGDQARNETVIALRHGSTAPDAPTDARTPRAATAMAAASETRGKPVGGPSASVASRPGASDPNA